ncbi:hypothetical protein CDL15_Pgr024615 [Punica granatum]|nr:hypothetical protein CDL15_Pgr024615 [Punica granatum]
MVLRNLPTLKMERQILGISLIDVVLEEENVQFEEGISMKEDDIKEEEEIESMTETTQESRDNHALITNDVSFEVNASKEQDFTRPQLKPEEIAIQNSLEELLNSINKIDGCGYDTANGFVQWDYARNEMDFRLEIVIWGTVPNLQGVKSILWIVERRYLGICEDSQCSMSIVPKRGHQFER